MKSFLKAAEEFAQSESDRTKTPPYFLVQLSHDKGQWLADKLSADIDIVKASTLLMDCQLGVAIQAGRIQDHVEMSAKKASELMSKYSELDQETRDNILSCINQHHGADTFETLEAEICCNADCYRFASIKGFIGSIRHMRDMPLKDMLKLLDEKADEKWNALSFDICKEELEPQYKLIKQMIAAF